MPLAKLAIPDRLREEAARIIRAALAYEAGDERGAIADLRELAMPRLDSTIDRMIVLRRGQAISRPR